jgi:hypothetical protein
MFCSILNAIDFYVGWQENVEPETRYLNITTLDHLDAHEFLMKMNGFRGDIPMRVDVQGAVRRLLNGVPLFDVEDDCAKYLIEWINAIIAGGGSGAGAIGGRSQHHGHASFAGTGSHDIAAGSQPSNRLQHQVVDSVGGYRMESQGDRSAPMYKVRHEVTRPTDEEFRDRRQNMIGQPMSQLQVELCVYLGCVGRIDIWLSCREKTRNAAKNPEANQGRTVLRLLRTKKLTLPRARKRLVRAANKRPIFNVL